MKACYPLKRGLTAAGLIAVLASAAPARADLLGYWPLDGDARAVVGVDGSPIGQPPATADRHGNPRGALGFDGARQQYVLIPAGSGLNGLSRGTISLWVKWDAVRQDPGAGNSLFGAVLGRQKNGQWSSNLLGLSGPDPAGASIRWRAGYRFGAALDTRSPIVPDRWMHVAVTFMPGEHVLYVDGKAEARNTETNALDNDYRCPLSIGAWIGDGDCYATASVDDVAVFSDALSPQQVDALARGNATPRTIVPERSPQSPSQQGLPALNRAVWIWSAPQAISLGVPTCLFRKTFELDARTKRATSAAWPKTCLS